MQFALLGDHPDGLDMARALAASGAHALLLYSGPAAGLQFLQRFGLTPRPVSDLEEVLADPAIDGVIIAGGPAVRAAQLRRAMQSECHVLCVHPVGSSPDIAYEAALIQADTGRVLLPLLTMTFHPGMARLADMARTAPPRLVELELWTTEGVLIDSADPDDRPAFPGWDVLRWLGGEITELFLVTTDTEPSHGSAYLISGRFAGGGLFQATLLPQQAHTWLRLSLVTTTGRATLLFPQGWPGAAQWTHARRAGRNS
jgi:hypothetical protein